MRTLAVLLLSFLPILGSAQDADAVMKKAKELAGIELTFREPLPRFQRLFVNKEESGHSQDGQKTTSYSFSVSGVPRDKAYILMRWFPGYEKPEVKVENVLVREDGKLGCGSAKDCPPNVPVGGVFWINVPTVLGLPQRFVLAEKNHNPVALGEDVAVPAIAEDHGCTIEAVLLTHNASATLLIGEGFVAREEVKYLSSSRGEDVNGSTQADASGQVKFVILPFVKGFEGGETNFSFRGSNCQPKTRFIWGEYKEDTKAGQTK